jgi:hypothetical protein
MTTPDPNHGTTEQQIEALDRGLLEVNARMDTLFASFRQVLILAGLPVPDSIPAPAAPLPCPSHTGARQRGGLRVVRGGAS